MGLTNATGKEFVEHWQWAADKGLMNVNTAAAVRAAVSKVLEIDGDWATMDVSKLNVDALLQRFQTLQAKEYKPDTLREYARRFRKGYESYMAYVRDPQSWKPGPTRPERAKPKDSPTAPLELAGLGGAGPLPDLAGLAAAMRTRSPVVGNLAFVVYPFPLRENCVVHLSLPLELKAADVQRITTFLNALVGKES